MRLGVVVLPGDGVGPEVTAAGVEVLRAVADRCGHTLEITEHPVGWRAVQVCGDPLPAETAAACLASGAVLLGAVGDPDSDRAAPARRPEAGLLRLRKELGCFANLRPARISKHLVDVSPLRPDIVRGTDLVVVRELAGGIYYGEASESVGGGRASNTMEYTADEIRRIANVAFTLARTRRHDVVSIDKANVPWWHHAGSCPTGVVPHRETRCNTGQEACTRRPCTGQGNHSRRGSPVESCCRLCCCSRCSPGCSSFMSMTTTGLILMRCPCSTGLCRRQSVAKSTIMSIRTMSPGQLRSTTKTLAPGTSWSLSGLYRLVPVACSNLPPRACGS